MSIDVQVKFQTSHGHCYRNERINTYKNKYSDLTFVLDTATAIATAVF